MIRVFPRKTNATPIDNDVYFDGPPLWRLEDKEVHVSCTFTWDKPRAESLAEMWNRAGYDVQLGGPAYDDKGGDFVPGRFIKHGYTMTSRGCNNRCWFCNTWKREGDIRELPIADGWNVLDSNLLQCSGQHIRKVFEMLKRQPEKARFTGGLEAVRLKDWHINLLLELKPHQLYFAYDTPDDYEPLVSASRVMHFNPSVFRKETVSCYVLIGYPKDTLDDAEKRLNQVKDLGITPMAMLYRDAKGMVDIEWQRFQRQWARPALIWRKK